MPRVRIICEQCGRQLAYVEIAPLWHIRATCPACRAMTEVTMDLAGKIGQTTTPAIERAARRAKAAGQSGVDGRKTG